MSELDDMLAAWFGVEFCRMAGCFGEVQPFDSRGICQVCVQAPSHLVPEPTTEDKT
jgi:hypothetical protein